MHPIPILYPICIGFFLLCAATAEARIRFRFCFSSISMMKPTLSLSSELNSPSSSTLHVTVYSSSHHRLDSWAPVCPVWPSISARVRSASPASSSPSRSPSSLGSGSSSSSSPLSFSRFYSENIPHNILMV